MISYTDLPPSYWAETVNTTCYTQNRSILHRGFNKTPYELANGIVPNIKHLHVFGNRCFVLNERANLGKFDSKADEGIFLGYSQESKAFHVLNKRTNAVVESINVTFDDTLITTSLSQESPAIVSGHISLGPAFNRQETNYLMRKSLLT